MFLFRGQDQDEGYLYLVLEFCAKGNLASYIQSHGSVQQQTARKFMHQVGYGLKVLHSHDIIHRDLKPEWSAYLLMNFIGIVLYKENGKIKSKRKAAISLDDFWNLVVTLSAMFLV
ncbi:hypothetical protein VNO80_19069 [Phaseolus coccineus]|uniref:Protein kinase domain-containing protein n=1 Tax=Phaseolus coccineus TaxID=3886 RepID=A0AAN9MLI1_PHACN